MVERIMKKLYVYEHCPYCIKARMIFGLTNTPVEIDYILNDDVETPTSMIGAKLVPILQKDDGSYMGESMDIVALVDDMQERPVFTGKARPEIAEWLTTARSFVYMLAMPRWVQTDMPEFATQGARDYFQNKKEGMIGNFADALAESETYIGQAECHLKKLDQLIESTDAVNGELSEDDIHLFATLHSLSIVKGLTFPTNVKTYMNNMSARSHVPLSTDIAI